MTEQEIDKLLLEIEVKDKTQGGSKELVGDFATAVSKLNEQIAKLDVSKFETISKAMSAISGNSAKATKNFEEQANALKAVSKAYKEMQSTQPETQSESGVDLHAQGGIAPQIDDMQEKASKSVGVFAEVNSQLDISQRKLAIVNEKLAEGNLTETQYLSLKEKQYKLEGQIANEQNKQEKASKSGLLSSIKRVAVYRVIRGILKAITNAFKEGFSNLAQYSSEVNGTLSQLKSSVTVVKNSVAVAFLPLLNAITPVVQQISVGIANLANTISYLSAKLQGNATYLKVNTEYLKEMNKQSNLLSFDTFEKLGSGIDYSGMFDEAKVADGFDNEELASSLSILGAISGVIIAIGASKLIGWVASGSLGKSLKNIGKSLSSGSGTLGIIIAGVALLAGGIADVVTSWNNANFESWEKLIVILTATFVGLATSIAAAAMAIQGMKGAGAVFALGLALAGATLLVGTEISKATSPKNYAFGGDYDSADLFYANENGQTELIASTNSGGGAVMNMQQLESAIYSGMIKAMASNSNGGESAVYLDGNKVGTFVASSSGFRNEANRRNTGLNWR